MKLTEISKGYIATITTTLIIGLSFLFVKISLFHTHPLDVLAHRFGIACIVLLPIAFWRRNELSLKKENLTWVLFMALLYPILTFGMQVWALCYISSAEAGIIHAVSPLITMGIAVLVLNEKISSRQGFFATVSVIGVLLIPLIQGVGSHGSILGYVLLLISSLALASYGVFARKLRVQFSSFSLAFFCITLGAILFNFAVAVKHLLLDGSNSYWAPLVSTQYVGAILYLGVLSSSLTLILSNYSYARIEASKLGIFANFVPVIAIFAGVSILGDSLNWVHLFGSFLIFIGVIGVNVSKFRKKLLNSSVFENESGLK